MNILLLSAYDATSHQYWRKALVSQLSEHQWTTLSLPARYFSWRLRGNSLSWGFKERSILEHDYDLVVATSMTDLSTLRGFIPKLANTPTLVYFHENQFAYPKSGHEFNSIEPQILNLYTALAADRVLFNTHFNRDSFLHGCEKLLNKLPDHVPRGLIEQLSERSAVLPVPIPDALFTTPTPQPGPLEIIWNHRWEFDKGPELLYQALRKLKSQTSSPPNWRLHIVGQQFRHVPDALKSIQKEFSEQLGTCGFIESTADYHQLLRRCDVVLSTALHDFQGIAVLEGVASGCEPLVPQRLAYPELLGNKYCYEVGKQEADSLASRLMDLANLKESGELPLPPTIHRLSWQQLKPAYQREIQTTANRVSEP